MKHTRWISPVSVAMLMAVGCGSGTATAADAAAIKGTITLQGTAPKPEVVKMSADPACQQQHSSPVYTEEVVVDAQNRLKNVFVYVKAGVSGPVPPAPAAPVQLDQRGCWYHPRVFGLQVNQPLEIINSDATLHNVNAKPAQNTPFNIAQPVKDMKSTKKFAKPEIGVSFKCNVHPWMRAYAGVVEHPFFSVSDAQGAFAISGLPAGQYTLEAWHEKYGTQTQTVTIGDGETKTVDFGFRAP
ncbi:MAG: carboxypeptidase regulatory-like domain-containing protein [Candidatus Omnitrophica bacterium]|nr:carboxypeptidase regulatory-like domain-containing protein [Candidatus Omnitrophota bacterium]